MSGEKRSLPAARECAELNREWPPNADTTYGMFEHSYKIRTCLKDLYVQVAVSSNQYFFDSFVSAKPRKEELIERFKEEIAKRLETLERAYFDSRLTCSLTRRVALEMGVDESELSSCGSINGFFESEDLNRLLMEMIVANFSSGFDLKLAEALGLLCYRATAFPEGQLEWFSEMLDSRSEEEAQLILARFPESLRERLCQVDQ